MSGLTIATVLTKDRYRPENWDTLESLEKAYQSLFHLNCNWEWLISYSEKQPPLAGSWKNDSRVRFIPAEPVSCLALNKLLAQSRYPYWVDLDAASQLLDGVNQIITALDEHPEVAYAYGHTVDFDHKSQTEIKVHSKHDFGIIEKGKLARYWLNTRGWWFVPVSGFWRRDVLMLHGGYPALSYDTESSALLKASVFYPVVSVDAYGYMHTKFKKQLSVKETFSADAFIEEQLNLLLKAAAK